MSKTTFSNKCAILGDLYFWYKDVEDDAWSEFFEWGDIGLPLAYFIGKGYANATNEGKDAVNEVWNVFCEMIEIDPEGKYSDLKSAFDASSRPVLV